MGFLDRAIRNGVGKALETAVTDKVLNVVAPKARENIQNNTDMLNQAAVGLGQAAEAFSAQARFCTNCGAPLPANMRFCSYCGTPAPAAQPAQAPLAQSSPAQGTDIRAAMPSILATDFSAYAVTQGLPAANLGSRLSPCKPYDYCLAQNGRPVAVIMLTDHNRDRNAAFLNAKQAARDAGVPFINFYTHFPNARDYVCARIRSFL